MKVKKTVIQEDFNNFLSREMKAKGLSIRKLASKAGISASYLSHLKTFNNSIPSNEILKKIASALEIDYETILIEAGRAPEDDVQMVGLMRAYGKLDDEDRKLIFKLVENHRKPPKSEQDAEY